MGFKALLQLTNFTLGPDATLNTEKHKNSVRIKAPNSVNASKRKHKNQINHYNKQRRVLMANSIVCQSKWKPIVEPRRAKPKTYRQAPTHWLKFYEEAVTGSEARTAILFIEIYTWRINKHKWNYENTFETPKWSMHVCCIYVLTLLMWCDAKYFVLNSVILASLKWIIPSLKLYASIAEMFCQDVLRVKHCIGLNSVYNKRDQFEWRYLG